MPIIPLFNLQQPKATAHCWNPHFILSWDKTQPLLHFTTIQFLKRFIFWKSPHHCLTLELKTKKVLSNYLNDYIERFRNISQGNVCDS